MKEHLSEADMYVAMHIATYDLIANGDEFRAVDDEQSMVEAVQPVEEEEELTVAQQYGWQLYDRYDTSTELALEKFDKFMPIDSMGRADMEQIREICRSTKLGAELVKRAQECQEKVTDRQLQNYAADLILEEYLKFVEAELADR